MSAAARCARVRALAKINLGLKVLNRRPDGYHELRTVFQTISLADVIEFEFTPARRRSIELTSSVEIPDNLMLRAAEGVMEAARVSGRLRMRLVKRIPMGGGLGGGSTDAAAVLLALPALAGRRLSRPALLELAARLGSDVPFFLEGGTAVAAGRGCEVYPLAATPRAAGLVVAPPLHVSTREAYRHLGRHLTRPSRSDIIDVFQSCVWGLTAGAGQDWAGCLENDFEAVVFKQHPQLRSLKNRLLRSGARLAMLAGSGAAVYGLFASRQEARRALSAFVGEKVFPITLVSRAGYRALWRRWLAGHIEAAGWPPQSRYAR